MNFGLRRSEFFSHTASVAPRKDMIVGRRSNKSRDGVGVVGDGSQKERYHVAVLFPIFWMCRRRNTISQPCIDLENLALGRSDECMSGLASREML